MVNLLVNIAKYSEDGGQIRLTAARLPAADPVEGPARPDPEPVTRPASRVLVVDDNVDTTRGLARLLERAGHEVHGGPEGIEAAREFRPGVVLLDIGLPGRDGHLIAESLRREKTGRDALIVAVSGYGQDDDRRKSRLAGFDRV